MIETVVSVESLIEKAKEKGLTVELEQQPKENREFSYWYGGGVAKVSKGNTSLLLDANGDVRCTYRTIEDGQEYEIFVKDKKNAGNFYLELKDEIESDEKLLEYIYNYEDDNNKFPQLEIENNNWWEVFVVIGEEQHDIMCVVEASTYSEALEMFIDGFDEYVDMV